MIDVAKTCLTFAWLRDVRQSERVGYVQHVPRVGERVFLEDPYQTGVVKFVKWGYTKRQLRDDENVYVICYLEEG